MKRPAFRLVPEGGPASHNVRLAIRARDECAPRRHAGNDGEHETVADDLHEFRAKLFGERPSPASLAVRPEPSSTEHLTSSRFSMVSSACLTAFFAQIVLADLDERIEFGGQAAQLLDLLLVSAICVPFLSTNTRSSLA